VLKADAVTVKGDESAANSTFELRGPIGMLDPVAQLLTVRGVTVHYPLNVQFSAVGIGDLAVGRIITVIGPLSADRTDIEAQSIAFD
jgi:hypothetical protein